MGKNSLVIVKSTDLVEKPPPLPIDDQLRIVCCFLWLEGIGINEIAKRLGVAPNDVKDALRQAQERGEIMPLSKYRSIRRDRRKIELESRLLALAPMAIKQVAKILQLPIDPEKPSTLRVIQQTAQWVVDRSLPKMFEVENQIPGNIKMIILERIERLQSVIYAEGKSEDEEIVEAD